MCNVVRFFHRREIAVALMFREVPEVLFVDKGREWRGGGAGVRL